jgi:YtfJ family uncharacterized protein
MNIHLIKPFKTPKKTLATSLIAIFLFFGLFSQTQATTINQLFPELQIKQLGELHLNDQKNPNYSAWTTQNLIDTKSHVILHMAGRLQSKKMQQLLIDALSEAKLDPEKLQVSSIIDANDHLWGTEALVINKAIENKKEKPKAHIIIDKQGISSQKLKTPKASATVFVLDKQKKIIYRQSGALSATDVQTIMALVRQQIK